MKVQIACALLLPVSLLAHQPEHARHAMVVTQEPLAADVGVRVLRAGGNAIDAAVAIAFALAVTYPYAGNIGGGGFLLARFADGRTTFIDFREKAPLKASRDMYLDANGNVTEDSLVGWRAAGVPGSVRGLELAHKKYGRKPWAELLDPAIELATEGYSVSYSMDSSLGSHASLLSQFPDSKRIFLNAHYGEKLVQPELAATLKRIRDRGASDFYEGETAPKARRGDGSQWRIDYTWRILKIPGRRAPAAAWPLSRLRDRHRASAQLGRHRNAADAGDAGGFRLREDGRRIGCLHSLRRRGDATLLRRPQRVLRRSRISSRCPISKLLDPRYIASRRASIDPQHATPSEQIRPGDLGLHESTETTHFNVVDSEGNAVAVTYTLNGGYGSGVTVPGLGFLLNNEMDDFAAKPGEENMFHLIQGEANAIQPGKRPLSSMTPTILLRDGKVVSGAGRAGRIAHH